MKSGKIQKKIWSKDQGVLSTHLLSNEVLPQRLKLGVIQIAGTIIQGVLKLKGDWGEGITGYSKQTLPPHWEYIWTIAVPHKHIQYR